MSNKSNESDTFFSIIIPTYNSELTLTRCLESIVSQTYNKFEVWFIDNVSTDKSLNIIQQFQGDYANLNYISEKDKGIYDAMNKGIDIANGNWLYFLGSDDTFYDNNVLSFVAKAITTSAAEVIYGNVIMRGKNQWNLDNVVFDGEYNTEKFIDRNICHQAMFYKKTVFLRNGYFNLKYVTNSDFDFNLRCYANSEFNYADVITANFFVGGHSTIMNDELFNKERGALLMKYFGRGIFSKSFMNARLYLQRAAFSSNSPLNFTGRVYCLLAYMKLKAQSMFITDK